MGLVALRKLGGVDYLVRVGDENPAAFLGFLGRVLPKEMVHEAGPNLLEAMRAAQDQRVALVHDVVSVQHDARPN